MYFRFSSKSPALLAALAALLLPCAAWSQESRPTPLMPPQQAAARQPQKMLTPAEIQEQQRLAIESYEAGEYLRFVQSTMRLRNARPYEPQYMVGMVVGSALMGRPKTAYSYMHIMQQQGLSYDFDQSDDVESIRNTEVYKYLSKLLVMAGEPNGLGKRAFELPESQTYPESIIWDSRSERFLVGTLQDGAILAVGLDGSVEELLRSNDANGLRAIYGLAVDTESNRLWVSTAATPAFKDLQEGELGRTALLEFELDSGKLLKRFEPPADRLPHLLGSIELASNGDVYVIDRALPIVFVKRAEGEVLEIYMGDNELTGFRDLAISDDGKRLYVADAELGILLVELEKDVAGMLGAPDNLNLGAISGIDYANGSLYVVQNGILPQRIQRLDLDPAGTTVANVIPLASGLEIYESPSFGAVQGDDFYYFAGANVQGVRNDAFVPVVLRTPLTPAEDMLTPEQRYYKETTKDG